MFIYSSNKITGKFSFPTQTTLIALGLLACLLQSTPLLANGGASKREPTTSLAAKVQSIRPSIVEIFVDGQRSGTGFVVSDKGHILTATHVVAEFPTNPVQYRRNIEVLFSDGQHVPATAIENPDPEAPFRDIALLSTGRDNTVPLKLSRSPMISLGSAVLLMGFPLQLPEAVVYTGIVASEYEIPGGFVMNHPVIKHMIQIEAPIAKGFSGSPLIDLESGEVVGVVEIKIGGINERLEMVGRQIKGNQGNVRISLGGIDTNETLLNLIAVLDQYLSAGTGSAVSVQHISDFVEHQILAKK